MTNQNICCEKALMSHLRHTQHNWNYAKTQIIKPNRYVGRLLRYANLILMITFGFHHILMQICV